MTLRIIFMGTPQFSVPTLQALHKAEHEIVACYTQPPRPAGRRGLELVPSDVQKAAEALDIPNFTPMSLKDAGEQAKFAALEADVAVVVAYGLLLPQAVLDAPKFGCFNGHASLLPRWRGAAPIQRAVMEGDSKTGIMIMKMDIGLDTGPVAKTAVVPISSTTTAGDLHDELSVIGGTLMVEATAALEDGSMELTPQSDDGVLYAAKISKSEARIDWSRPADEVRCHINGLSPFPGAWCEMELGGKVQRVKVLQADSANGAGEAGEVLDGNLTIACGEGAVSLLKLHRAGSKQMDADEFMRGNSVPVSTVLS